MRYRVELEGLLAFVDTLQAFERHAESIAARVDEQVTGLHDSWLGEGASAHLTLHQEWMTAAHQMREALAQLRELSHRTSKLHRSCPAQYRDADVTQDVDPDTFYSVGIRLFELAGDVYDAFAVNVRILGETGTMAGTDDAGTAWAASYDGRASEVLGAVNDLTLAMENYGGVVIQAGYNHAVAEYNATPGNQGPPPQRPA